MCNFFKKKYVIWTERDRESTTWKDHLLSKYLQVENKVQKLQTANPGYLSI